MKTIQKLTVEKNDPRLCIAGTEDLWSICRQNSDDAGISTEVLAENVEHADALLFAAAPELLEALIPLQAWAENERRRHSSDGEEGEADHMGWLADKARAAIAKAEGREA